MLFKDVIGHQHIKETLINSVRSSRVSHAQMFIGQNGTGALPMALAYAQYVNCKNPGENDSCGECDPCKKTMTLEYADLHFSFPVITKKLGEKPKSADFLKEFRKAVLENPYLSYPDWMETIAEENKQGNISAEEARDIIKRLSFKPMYEGFKIMLIWMPERLGKEGNILLKILEEPPVNTLFLLVAQSEEQILPTILSRTQVLRIPAIETSELERALQERLEMDAEEAARIAYLAQGNYNTALQMSRDSSSNYTEEFIVWMRLCFKPDWPGIVKWVDNMATTGRESQKNFLVYGLRLLREAFLLNKKVDELTHLLPSEKEFIIKFSPHIGEENITELSEIFSKAHFHIERNAHPKILFFNLSLQVNGLLQRHRQRA